MLIGKPGAARTAISAASSDRVTVRGRDLANDLMGRTSFTDYVFLLATGRTPTEDLRRRPGRASGRDRRWRARLRLRGAGHG